MEFMGASWLKAFLTGASAGVVVIFGNTLFKMLKTSLLKSFREFAIFAIVVGVVLWFKIHPFLGLVLGTSLALCLPERLFASKASLSGKNAEGGR